MTADHTPETLAEALQIIAELRKEKANSDIFTILLKSEIKELKARCENLEDELDKAEIKLLRA